MSGSSGRSHHEVAQVLNVHKQQFKDYDSTLTHLGSRLDSVFAGDTGESLVNRFFNKALEKHFHAESHMVNFASNAEEARKQINVWVSDHTCKKIPDLMTQNSIDSRTRLVLGAWKEVYRREATMAYPFQALMMERFSHEMLIVLPDTDVLELMEKIFDPYHFSHFKELFDKSKYESNRVELHLPKFKLGGGERQNVNEAGAEAAAATGMAVTPMCMCSEFTVDHPFLFFIVTETGVPAFMGHVINPLA
uniref:Plasminogen activator inhibitor 2 n=1 Tax=Echinococcus granulosus TaxID=6210 RepID=U6FTZ3_ECHGR|nr:plasminogen activator inhibitor 2 [Echinococcus granulosus]